MSQPDPKDTQLLVFDVDGVLTDGTINLDDHGVETKRFNVRDGFGMKLWMNKGFQIAIITGRSGLALRHRLETFGIEDELIIQGSGNKSESLDKVLAHTGIDEARIAYLGDDWPDLPALNRVGYPMAVADAEPEVIAKARYITTRKGGHGAARDAIAHLLECKGLYSPE